MIRKNWATIRTEGKARVAEKEFSIFFLQEFLWICLFAFYRLKLTDTLSKM